jgi:uncharacterized protein
MNKPIYVKNTPDKGLGVYAARDIRKDEIISEFTGPRITIENLGEFPPEVVDHLFNVGTNEYLVTREPEVRTNHSCDPNAGIRNEALLLAMRDIPQDEEITFDYSMIMADDWEMDCLCGSPLCRKRIGRYQDLPPAIKDKYRDYIPDWIRTLCVDSKD